MFWYGRIFNFAGSAAINRKLLSSRNGLANVQPCATLKGKALEKLGIPPKPKRPLTSYMTFLKTEAIKVRAEEPNLKPQDVTKRVAQKWANYDPIKKEALQKAYHQELLAYSKQLMIYDQSITSEHQKIIENAKKEELAKKEKLKLKKKTEELGKPRRPRTAFILYMQERRLSKSHDGNDPQWMRNTAEEWRGMTAAEKEKYQCESKKLKDQYTKDMEKWEEKMIRLGHIDVLRNRALTELAVNCAAKPE